MKKIVIIILIIFGLSMIMKAQGVLTNLSLITNFTHFQRVDNGNGNYYYSEFRWLPLTIGDSVDIHLGFFVNYFTVNSKLDEFSFNEKDISFGASLNWSPRDFSKRRDAYVWLNAGYKSGTSNGWKELYQEFSKNQNLIFSSGLIIKRREVKAPFFLQKFYLAYQRHLMAKKDAYWDKKKIDNDAWKQGYIQFNIENTLSSWALTKSENLRFDPKIIIGSFYGIYPKKIHYSAGIGFNLTGRYNQEIVSCAYLAEFSHPAGQNNIVQISVDVVQIVKLFHK